ncbi:HAD-IIIC family phosphatase [Achromobacter pestifer]
MKAKLVIWDLDDTLWKGTLAEGDDVEVFDERVELIKELNACGVVNSICSKNDFDTAKTVLEQKGLWDLFVFPEIAFEPKGALVQRIVKDMQLRAPDVIFIDDNPLNLREVEHANDSIRVVDATTNETNDLLRAVLQAYSGKKKSRVEEYRILEQKRGDAKQLALNSNEEFLATCEIKVCIVERTDNLRFAKRIEELINRTNQLNFLKSRVLEGSMPEYIAQSTLHDTFSVFVWDKYGYYGLVGFAAIERRKRLVHFAFSCRVMNMGIEAALSAHLQRHFKDLDQLPVAGTSTPWIEFLTVESPEFKEISAGQDERGEALPVRIMANCQSGSIAHYLGYPGVDWDNWPRVFSIGALFNKGVRSEEFKKLSIYGAFNDYSLMYWQSSPTVSDYKRAVELFVESIPDDGAAISLLPPERFTASSAGLSPDMFAAFNKVWRDAAASNSQLAVVDVYEIEPFSPLIKDPRHYTPAQLLSVSRRLKILVDEFLATGCLPKADTAGFWDGSIRASDAILSRIVGHAWCIYAEPNSRLSDVEVQGTIYVGFASTVLSGVIRSYVEIGRYCTIGRRVTLGADPVHASDFSGSSFFDFAVQLNVNAMASMAPKRRIVVGHDCKIGDGAVIASGVTLGHGCVVLPNAYVGRDVLPYEIVSGNGVSEGFRFGPTIREKLLDSAWWDKDPNAVRTLAGPSAIASLEAFDNYTDMLDFPNSYRQFKKG